MHYTFTVQELEVWPNDQISLDQIVKRISEFFQALTEISDQVSANLLNDDDGHVCYGPPAICEDLPQSIQDGHCLIIRDLVIGPFTNRGKLVPYVRLFFNLVHELEICPIIIRDEVFATNQEDTASEEIGVPPPLPGFVFVDFLRLIHKDPTDGHWKDKVMERIRNLHLND